MGLISDIQNLINEHGSSSILRERLLLLQEKVAEIEEERRQVVEELANARQEAMDLRAELDRLKVDPGFKEHLGAVFKRKPSGSYAPTPCCPHCHSPMASEFKVFNYKCSKCGHIADFTGNDLPEILNELEC